MLIQLHLCSTDRERQTKCQQCFISNGPHVLFLMGLSQAMPWSKSSGWILLRRWGIICAYSVEKRRIIQTDLMRIARLCAARSV
jgi:hypothetical protein